MDVGKRGSQEWLASRTEAPASFSPWGFPGAVWQLTWGKPVWTWQTLVVLLLLGLALCGVAAHRWLRGPWPADDFIAEVLVPAYLGFLMPMVCLSSGVQVLGGAWEEGWLLWLLLRPVPRSAVYLIFLLAAVPWTLLMSLGGALALASAAGTDALRATVSVLVPIALGGLAYLTLFVFFSVVFRRAALVSIAYVFVVENFIGYMPGLISRASISFYLRSLLAEAGWLVPNSTDTLFPFQATSGSVARGVLLGTSVLWTGLGAMLFARREYADPNL